ncbi:MAG: pyridoxal phosphate-dependent aminotransferase [Deltaproteobacteria bacterium]|nr:pyridoxal phosphate-dependent aminotransferase [Deltaproteobacteria bacterium]
MSFYNPSQLVSSFEESATLALSAKAKKLAASGKSVINFGVGEPDFNTPKSFIEAAFKAAEKGQTKYTAVGGTPNLRETVAAKISRDYRVAYSAEEVLVSSGGKQAIFHFLQATVEPGDEVIILSPYWVSFPEMVKMVGGRPIIVNAKSQRITADEIAAKISPKTKAIILNSPSNPSGLVFTREEVESYSKLLLNKNIWLLCDDTYYKLIYSPAEWVSPLHLHPELKEKTCLIGSASKSYAMTGWRLGWALGPKPLIAAMTKLQSQVTSNPSSLSQAAAEEALKNGDSFVEDFRKIFEKRRNLVISELQKIPGLQWMEPEGAFYIFIDFSKLIPNVTDFCEKLLDRDGVCLIPGEAFGAPSYARLSYALSDADIKEGIRRIEVGLKALT